MAGRVGLRSRISSSAETCRTTVNVSPTSDHRLGKGAQVKRQQHQQENNAMSSEDEDENDDEDEDDSTLRAMSTLSQQERAHPTMNPAATDKSPSASVAKRKDKAPTATTALTLKAVRQLIHAVEQEMLVGDPVGGDDTRLVVALESAKYELADDERRRRADWTRVLVLASQLKCGSASPLECAAELVALAQSRVGKELDAAASTTERPHYEDVDWRDDHHRLKSMHKNDTSSSDAAKRTVVAVDSNQNEDDGPDPVEEKKEPTPQQSDELDEPSGDWIDDGPTACRRPAEIELTTFRAAKLPLSLTVAKPIKKSIQEPKPPKAGCGGHAISNASASSGCMSGSSGTVTRSARLKFQFPDADVTQWQDIEDDDAAVTDVDGNGLVGPAASSRPTASNLPPRRRVSAAVTASASALNATANVGSGSVITGAVPLRRKSFTMKRSPCKNLLQMLSSSDATSFSGHRAQHVAFSPPPSDALPVASAPPHATSMRRKSTSAFDAKHLVFAQSVRSSRRASFSPVARFALSPGHRSASRRSSILLAASPSKSSSATTSAGSQLVLRVRERKGDGVRELVLRKKTRGLPVVWHWHDRHRGAQSLLDEYERVVKLGPHQHGVMLRQLRFVKSAMHEFPWAKTHLRNLLTRYTSQQLSKEALYPQLALLSTQVQSEVATKAARAKEVAARKQRLTVQLTLATGVVNDIRATKFGRRGRPHATRLCYDPSDPLRLRWVRKSGERSDEFLVVDELVVLEQERALSREGSNFDLKRVAKGSASASASSGSNSDGESDCACLLSLVTSGGGAGGRALDLCVKSPLHREWLAMALREIAAFARQFRASGAAATPRRRIANGI